MSASIMLTSTLFEAVCAGLVEFNGKSVRLSVWSHQQHCLLHLSGSIEHRAAQSLAIKLPY